MKICLKNKKLLVVILLFVIMMVYILHNLYIIYIPNPLEKISDEEYCEVDADCVPDRLCHATKVINKNYLSQQGNGAACTLDCVTILDCGRGKPVCKFNKCTIQRIW